MSKLWYVLFSTFTIRNQDTILFLSTISVSYLENQYKSDPLLEGGGGKGLRGFNTPRIWMIRMRTEIGIGNLLLLAHGIRIFRALHITA